jgi:hypothetical protein
MSNDLIILSTLVLLPLIPAFLLFKALPSKAVVKGPLAGLNVDLGGAFGGYVALTVFLATFYATRMSGPETWTIEGELRAAEGAVPPAIACTLRPPVLKVDDDRFQFNIPIAEPNKPLRLIFDAPGYIRETVDLKGPDGKFGGSYHPKVYQSSQTIVLQKPIVFTRKPT